jgi:hypothetical protein
MGSRSPEAEGKACCTRWEEKGEQCNGTYSVVQREKGRLDEGNGQGLREE